MIKYDKVKLKRILLELKDLGIKRAYIYFDGSGDDGEIHDIDFQNYLHDRPPAYNEVQTPSDKIMEDLRDWAYDMITEYVDGEYGGDWVNNDGGYGNINLNVQHGSYHFNYSQRTTDDMSWEGDL